VHLDNNCPSTQHRTLSTPRGPHAVLRCRPSMPRRFALGCRCSKAGVALARFRVKLVPDIGETHMTYSHPTDRPTHLACQRSAIRFIYITNNGRSQLDAASENWRAHEPPIRAIPVRRRVRVLPCSGRCRTARDGMKAAGSLLPSAFCHVGRPHDGPGRAMDGYSTPLRH